MIEFKNYDLWDEVKIGPYTHEIACNVGTSRHYLIGKGCSGIAIFIHLGVEKSSYVKKITGQEYGGGFPEVETLEDLNKVIKQLQIDCLIKEAKEKYPVGTVFKSIFNKLNYTSSGKFEWLLFQEQVIRDINVYGIVWSQNKWAEIITEEPKQPEINTYGLKVGDKLEKDVISKWGLLNYNRYQSEENDGEWGRGYEFVSDREITSFKEFHGIVGFLVSGTNEVYLKAEGFKEFAEGFNKPEFEFEVGKWYKRKGGYSYAIKYLRKEKRNSKDVIIYSDIITGSGLCKLYPEGSTGVGYADENGWYELTDLSEIQEYLPDNHPDKTNNHGLIPGRWYKVQGSCEYIAKFVGIKKRDFITPGYFIRDGKYTLNHAPDNRLINIDRVFTEVSIEEIQQYLPYNHPDKIKTQSEYIVGKWYRMGEWVAKFKELKYDQFWCSISGTPHDNYKYYELGNLSIERHGTPQLITDMREVYKLFPEEKPENDDFEVNDWVVVEQRFRHGDIPLPQTCQIFKIDNSRATPYLVRLSDERDSVFYFRKEDLRYANSEEVDKELERRWLAKKEKASTFSEPEESVIFENKPITLKSRHADTIDLQDQQVPKLTITIKTNKLFVNSIKTITL